MQDRYALPVDAEGVIWLKLGGSWVNTLEEVKMSRLANWGQVAFIVGLLVVAMVLLLKVVGLIG